MTALLWRLAFLLVIPPLAIIGLLWFVVVGERGLQLVGACLDFVGERAFS